ncbi:MAG: NADH-quinone oxidoreductase subunit C [Candidatus Zixiibacteriota bacterium]
MNRDELTTYLTDKFGDKIELLETGAVEPIFLIKSKDDLLDFCKFIKEDDKLDIDFLCNMCGVDTGERFEVVYNVASIRFKHRFDFKIVLEYEGAEFESMQTVWAGINWFEREVWELYGINVLNHGNLKRFLLPDEWNEGHPMRKNWDSPDFKRMPEV